MQNSCKQCAEQFEVEDEDLQFYDKVSPYLGGKKYLIPPPTHCPKCRQMRRMAWRNIRTLYMRECDLCKKSTLSLYSKDKPTIAYCRDCYNSDKWDAASYARDFDFDRPFFEQFDELNRAVPAATVDVKENNENCEYTNYVANNSNTYLVFAATLVEDSYYSMYLQRSRDIVDSYFVFDSELCYECIDCYNCYDLKYSQNCQNCSTSAFLYDCRGCKNCFGCVSLANKEYFIFNKSYPKEEYERKVAEIMGSRESFKQARKEFESLKESLPHKYYSGVNNESVTGDHVYYSKNSYDCYDSTELEDCKYCTWMHKSKNCYDCHGWGLPGELGYEFHLSGFGTYKVRFSESCWESVSDLMYCRYCMYKCSHLFGCVGLERKSYCILNKQYSQEEYEELVPRIIEHMKKTGEWGEFFPVSIAPFGYNETEGIKFWPLTKDEALARGMKWKEVDVIPKSSAPKMDVPFDIREVSDEIVGKTFACGDCGKDYKIIAKELAFYRKMEVTVPHKCHNCRYEDRVSRRSQMQLFDRSCDKCGVDIKTTYSNERPEKVYCEKCYLGEVY